VKPCNIPQHPTFASHMLGRAEIPHPQTNLF
jgi:hypothetical protein